MGIIRRLEKQSSLGDWIIRSSRCCGRFSSHFYNEHFLGCKSFEWIFKWDKKFKKNVKLASERRGFSVSWVWCGQFIKNENAAIRKYIMHTNIRLSCVQYSNLWKRRRRSCYVSWLWWHLVRKVCLNEHGVMRACVANEDGEGCGENVCDRMFQDDLLRKGRRVL